MPFDAMVEVGGALGPSFEAQAVNLSEEGMSLRTAYLPEVGQPVMCRFDAGQGMSVVAAGEVLWKDDMGDGGEFGIRFTNLDGQSTVALQRILGMAEDGQIAMADPHGRKVRLHIEGLASPMRARIKAQAETGVTAYSELGFLQMGKPLELEDASSGNRRPALIDRVEVEVNGESRIPQLVVSLRYDDTDGRAMAIRHAPSHHDQQHAHQEVPVDEDPQHEDEQHASHEHDDAIVPGPSAHGTPSGEHEAPAVEVKTNHEEDVDEESNKLKSAFARNAAKVTPALLAWAKRAKITAALLAAKARRGRGTGDDVEIPMRRTTAPAPGGGLHASGRKVVRGSAPDGHLRAFEDEQSGANAGENQGKKASGIASKITKKRVAIASTVGIALILVFFAMRKPAAGPQLASAPPGDASGTAQTSSAPGAGAPGAANAQPGAGKPLAPPNDPLAAAAAAMNGGSAPGHKGGKPIPFTNGPVGAHPNVIKIKMDGNIDGIQGATQPTGFTIVTPNRKSMDPTNTLAGKDPRFADVQVSNEAGGAEFNVTFKDGVPNYLVRAHGDTLELVLASPSTHEKAEAKASGGKKKKGKKH